MDGFGEAVVVFGADGETIYTNARAREILAQRANGQPRTAATLMPILARLGGRMVPLRINAMAIGEAVFVPEDEGVGSLAERERRAIVETLDRTEWRLAETARLLGISRTTLWRRLKAYGLDRDRRGRWPIQH